jgi:hypothetical protein
VAWASDRRGYWNIRAARNSLTGVQGPERSGPFVVRAAPNPFRDRTRLSGPSVFSVDVFGVDGRRVARLDSRNGEAAWSPAGLAPGVYVAHVAAPGTNSTIRLIRAR